MGPLALLAGVVIPDKAAGYGVIQNIIGDGVEDHFVDKGRGLDQSLFGFVDIKGFKLAGLIGAALQYPGEPVGVGQDIRFILRCGRFGPFAFPGFQVGVIEDLKGAYLLVCHGVPSFASSSQGTGEAPGWPLFLTLAAFPSVVRFACMKEAADLSVMCLSAV